MICRYNNHYTIDSLKDLKLANLIYVDNKIYDIRQTDLYRIIHDMSYMTSV